MPLRSRYQHILATSMIPVRLISQKMSLWRLLRNAAQNGLNCKTIPKRNMSTNTRKRWKDSPTFMRSTFTRKMLWNTLKRRSMLSKKLRFPADPNAPKRALSSYFIFITDPGMDVEFTGPAPARVKILSEKWNNFTAEQKKPFEERSAELKAEYDKVREEYIGTAEYDQYNAQKRAWTYQRNQRIKKLQTDLKKQQMGDMGVSDDDMVSSWEAKKAKQ
eukprot:1019336_1